MNYSKTIRYRNIAGIKSILYSLGIKGSIILMGSGIFVSFVGSLGYGIANAGTNCPDEHEHIPGYIMYGGSAISILLFGGLAIFCGRRCFKNAKLCYNLYNRANKMIDNKIK